MTLIGGTLVTGISKPSKRPVSETSHYKADGCDYHPVCHTCPLPVCRYEHPGGLRGVLNAARDAEIVLAREESTSREVAQKFTVSKRTVYRVLGRVRLGAT